MKSNTIIELIDDLKKSFDELITSMSTDGIWSNRERNLYNRIIRTIKKVRDGLDEES